MARRRDGGADTDVRAYLLRQAVALRAMYGRAGDVMWRELSKPVEQLESGGAYTLHRYELPGDHPARYVGGAEDLLTLDAADVLHIGRLVATYPPGSGLENPPG